ncbi:Hypothetical protein ORPV_205 [Orpheovirus IHUMI-LCC2]|uniref:Uncharacterized protein n=1 Tax=Orpheovirus IHUMI-LCC2 TaxID=2023057 RepID=A0A2I2L3Q9_9VIRU|nr:Hypothetical protein ORPV_205 [Orpheovirus IHUMI-LCC2]SNW62109.1 Hypothetical protein ORPV_205 [Orpheovirus IHUMI-LCC2]
MDSYIKLLPLDIIKNEILPNLSQRDILNVLKAFPCVNINPSYYNKDNLSLKMTVEMDATYQLNEFLNVITERSMGEGEVSGYIYYILKISCKVNNILMFKDYIRQYMSQYNSNEWDDWLPIIIRNNNKDILLELLKYITLRSHTSKIYESLDGLKWNNYEGMIYNIYENISYSEDLFLLLMHKGSMNMIINIYNLWKDEISNDTLSDAFNRFCKKGFLYRRSYKDYSEMIYFIIDNMKEDCKFIKFEDALLEMIRTYPMECYKQYIFSSDIRECFIDAVRKINSVGHRINWQNILCYISANTYEEMMEKFLFVYNESSKESYIFNNKNSEENIRDYIMERIYYLYEDEDIDIRCEKLKETESLLNNLNL